VVSVKREWSCGSLANLGSPRRVGVTAQGRLRCRYTEWLEGTHVEFTAFPWERRVAGHAPERLGGEGGDYEEFSSDEEDDEDAWVLLKRLRHPLLHGWYLQRLAQWQQQQVRPGLGVVT